MEGKERGTRRGFEAGCQGVGQLVEADCLEVEGLSQCSCQSTSLSRERFPSLTRDPVD